MTYYPVSINADDRRTRGLEPRRLVNMHVVKTAEDATRGRGFAIVPTPGTTRLATPQAGAVCRGLFHEDGVAGGSAYGVFGSYLYLVAADGSCTQLGFIAGSDAVVMKSERENLVIAGGGRIYKYDGATLTANADANAPFPCYALAALGGRALGSQFATDILAWSAVANALDWPALAFASSEVKPDPIEGMLTVGTEQWILGRATWQIYNVTGSVDETAFTNVTNFAKDTGLLTRDLLQPFGGGAMWVDQHCVPVRSVGYAPTPVPHPALTARLLAMSDTLKARTRAFTHHWDQKELWSVRMPDGGASLVYDGEVRRWHERTTFGADAWALGFSCEAYGKVLVGGPESDGVFTLERDVYTDDDGVIERRFMVAVPVSGTTRINSITLDVKPFGVPVLGQGSNPKIRMQFYRDGGSVNSVDAIGVEREFAIGRNGVWNQHPTEWGFGIAEGVAGILLEFICTDPVGFMFAGVYVNEPQR